MNDLKRITLAVAALACAGHATAAITFYENDAFQGRSFTTEQTVNNFERAGFNDRASSVVVRGNRSERWEVCEDRRFRGRCVILRPGQYPSLQAMGQKDRVTSVRAVDRDARYEDHRYAPTPPPAPASQVTFYEHDGFQGRSFTAESPVADFGQGGFNDRASSVVVRGALWEVCEDARYRGRCVVLRPGQYATLSSMGLNDRVSSVREVDGPARVEDRPTAAPPPAPVSQVTFYEHDGFQGRSFTAESPVADFGQGGFNDRASSVVVRGALWEMCEDARYRGRCVVLRPGQYATLSSMGLNDRVSSVREVGGPARVEDRPTPAPPPAPPSQAVFFEHEGFQGRSFTAESPVIDFGRFGFNDRASSVVVRGALWEVCEDASYSGRCAVLRPGQYPTLSSMGLNDHVSSVREVGAAARVTDERYAPQPALTRDYGRRNEERLYQANITSVRAVVDTAGQRCWVEREQVSQGRGNANVPGALLGAVIGGVLGHQVGGGTGRDVATGLGAIAGAVIGANQGREGGQQVTTQNVQRCSSAPEQARPTYWDVTYNFRGVEHRVQMTSPPGATVQVNDQGEPRA